MILIPILLVVAVLIAYLTRGVPDMQAADDAVEAAKQAAGDTSTSAYDIAAALLKFVVNALAVITVLYALATVAIAVNSGAL